MEPAYVYYAEKKGNSDKSVPKSIFTQRPTIVEPGVSQKRLRSDNCSGSLENAVQNKKNKAERKTEDPCHTEPSSEVKIKKKISTLSNEDAMPHKPFVVDSFSSCLDIIPINKVPTSGHLYCTNLPCVEGIYTGPPSKFLDKERLSKFASLLMLPDDTECLTEVDSTTSTRLKYSNFICPCGHISDITRKDNHQKECYISITADAIRLNNYQSLMPKMCSEIELKDLPRIDCTEKNEVEKSANAVLCSTGRTIYFGIETGEKCGRVTRDYVDRNKRPKHLQRAYKCPACSFWCIEFSRFSSHFSTHESQKPFGCSVCLFKSAKNFGVSRHIQMRKRKDVLHKDAVVLSDNVLKQNSFAQFKAYIVVTNCAQKKNAKNS